MITPDKLTRIKNALGSTYPSFIAKKANAKGIKNLKGGDVSYQTVNRLAKGKSIHPELEAFIIELVEKMENC